MTSPHKPLMYTIVENGMNLSENDYNLDIDL